MRSTRGDGVQLHRRRQYLFGTAAVVVYLLVMLVACGSVNRPPAGDDGPPPPPPTDAPPPPPTPSREIVGGAGRLTGVTFRLDVEIGHAVSQQPAASATYKMEGNTAVKP